MSPHRGAGTAIGIGATISAAAGVYKLGELLVHTRQLFGIGKENDVFVRLIDRVRSDVIEADRLVHHPTIEEALSTTPEKAAWIRGTIHNTKKALGEMVRHTARVRKDFEHGWYVGLFTRIRWVMHEHEMLVRRSKEVSACHNSLTQVLAFLAPLEPLACCEAAGELPQTGGQGQGQNQKITTTYREFEAPPPAQFGPRREEVRYRVESRPREEIRRPEERYVKETYRQYEVPHRGEPRFRDERYVTEIHREQRGQFDGIPHEEIPIRTNWPINTHSKL